MNKRRTAYGMITYLNRFSPVKRDVIILQPAGIGDFVIWHSTAKQLREYFRDRKITLICSACCGELAAGYGFFDEIITLDGSRRDYLKLLGLKSELLLLPFSSPDKRTLLAVKAIRAREKIAPENDYCNCSPKQEKEVRPDFSRVIEMPDLPVSEFERNRVFCSRLTGEEGEIRAADLSCFIKTPASPDPYYVVNPSSSNPRKNWPAERFAAVSNAIWEQYHIPCRVIGTMKEKGIAGRFFALYRGEYEDMLGKTSVGEMISVIANARFVLANDTGATHIAAACGTECFCTAHGALYPRFTSYPEVFPGGKAPHFIDAGLDCFGCLLPVKGVKSIKPECRTCAGREHEAFPCLDAVSAEKVIKEVFDYLEKEQL